MAKYSIPRRFWVGCMSFCACAIANMLQSNLSITLLAMIDSDAEHQPDFGPRYKYTPYELSVLLGAYYITSSVCIFPIAVLLDRFNCVRNYVLWGSVLTAIGVAIIPSIAWSFALLLAVRLAIGVALGCTYPAMQKLITRWAPQHELGKFMFTLTGVNCGTIFSWSVSGLLIETFGWHYSFYMASLVTAVFCVFWWYLAFDSPATHPRISAAEREHIEASRNADLGKSGWVPVAQMLTSIPALVLIFFQYGNMWGYLFLINFAPMYLSQVHNFTLASSGLLACLPYIARVLCAILFALLSDYLRPKRWMSLMNLRRLFTVFSYIIPGLIMIVLPYSGTDPYVCVALITVSYGFNGAILQSAMSNVQDLTPNFAASLMAVSDMIGLTCGFVTPLVVTYFTTDDLLEGWRKVFLLGAALYIIPALTFICFGSASVQPWNTLKESAEADKQTKGVGERLKKHSVV